MIDQAHDTLRDELHRVLWHVWQNPSERPADYAAEWTDAVLPVVLRYADAQVAAERERLATAVEDYAERYGDPADNGYQYAQLIRGGDPARIARGQP
jgi:hypothetical protein